MKKLHFKAAVLAAVLSSVAPAVWAEAPDSVYVYLYANTVDHRHGGLHWAWSADGERWVSEFPDQSLVKSDFGAWGSQKMMYSPYTLRGEDGLWHVLWGVNENTPTFAVATSRNLIDWEPQVYPQAGVSGENCIDPQAVYDAGTRSYLVTWETVAEGDTAYVGCMTSDFHNFSAWRTVPGNTRDNRRVHIPQVSPTASGTVCRISRDELRLLQANARATAYTDALYRETYRDDSRLFAGLKPVKARMQASDRKPVAISDKLIGIFFEDISRAADGGLYAELLQNRDFEYNPHDLKGRKPEWNASYAWSTDGSSVSFAIDSVAPIHPNNPHYATLTSTASSDGALVNSGLDGIPVSKGARYDFSAFVRAPKGKLPLKVELVDKSGSVIASAKINASAKNWKKQSAVLTPDASVADARLRIVPTAPGVVQLDMVSLFPRDTFHGRRNGLRRDLADTIAALNPRFVRFPGGCVTHGDGLGNIYNWKNTIGPLEARKPMRNIWGYHQSMGLGYHEYFEFCEDLGAEPLPVIAAGVPCQNSSDGGHGQQGGVPMEDMPAYIQDILDLVEYANGSTDTRWGKERARNGHPAPFNLKYLGIGNEDLISDIFEERFTMIYNAVKEKYPDITVVGTAGPFHSGSDYDAGWRIAAELGVPVVDEHYYEAPAWFIYNNSYYDGYDRNRGKVYLGEYASRGNELFNALAEAAYLCGIERNADVVEMTSYAPMLAREGKTNWNPDLIYFTGTEVHPTVNYHVQKLFGNNMGSTWLPFEVALEGNANPKVAARIKGSASTAADGSRIVKLVNILPVEVSMELPDGFSGDATVTTLAGEPSARQLSPTVSRKTISGAVTLAPYSFTVIRL